MNERSLESEILDDPMTPYSELKASLDYMSVINRYFGGIASVLGFLERAKPPAEFTVLDIGTGSGDVPQAIDRWAHHRGQSARVTAIDLNPYCLRYAKERHASPNVEFVCSSAFDLTHLGRFDYIVSSMFFHHLKEPDIVRLLGLMAVGAKRGFLVNDLYRGRLAHLCARATAAMTGNRTVKNDAALSVRRGFRPADFERFKNLAGLRDARILRRPMFRILLECHVECPENRAAS